jgi:hypothetical protein
MYSVTIHIDSIQYNIKNVVLHVTIMLYSMSHLSNYADYRIAQGREL